jgi:hypothetical protein
MFALNQGMIGVEMISRIISSSYSGRASDPILLKDLHLWASQGSSMG